MPTCPRGFPSMDCDGVVECLLTWYLDVVASKKKMAVVALPRESTTDWIEEWLPSVILSLHSMTVHVVIYNHSIDHVVYLYP